MKQFIKAAPCAKCPFRKDVPIYLRSGRREEIVEALREDQTFYCHATVEYWEDEDGFEEPDTTDSQMCAGAAKALMMAGGTTNILRISARLGFADLDKTEEAGAEVWSLSDWPRLAEGSTGDNPEWEIGDEDGVRTCSYVGPNCLAPAGYLSGGGAVIEGTVEAELECEGCGEPVCEECCDDEGYCGFCSEVDE